MIHLQTDTHSVGIKHDFFFNEMSERRSIRMMKRAFNKKSVKLNLTEKKPKSAENRLKTVTKSQTTV